MRRIRALMWVLVVIWALFAARLFYLQVIRGDYYRSLALDSQERKFEIAAERGSISALDRDEKAPLALNENLPTIFADPRYIDDHQLTAEKLSELLGGDSADYFELLSRDTAYVVIKKRATLAEAKLVDEANLKGVGALEAYYRAYPEGQLAAQVLGFVNDEGAGQYGIEEYLNDSLAGEDGRVRAITDASGIPLRGEPGNVLEDPVNGTDITLTIDVNLQRQVEDELKRQVKEGRAKGGSAIVVDPHSGAIKAIANYPTFNPAKFSSVKDFSVFVNGAVASPFEAGSVAKVLTMSAGINEGVVARSSTYYDAGYVKVDDRTIENVGVPGGVTRTMDEVIQYSINTGAVHVLKELGGGKFNAKGRKLLYNYLSERFGFGKLTGVEQAAEAKGTLHSPSEGDGLNIRYANMTFGQGMTLTMVQMAGAVSAIVNGGTYYQPHLVYSRTTASGVEVVNLPTVVKKDVISAGTSQKLKNMMELVVQGGGGTVAKKSGYKIGGKTGTAQVPLSDGTYSESREIGTFVGYVEGGNGVEYVIMTRIDEPLGYLYAGSGAAAPLFARIAHFLIDYGRIPPLN